MIDEWMGRQVDRICDWAPRYFGPRMTRFAGTRLGWRMKLYASAVGRSLWGALTSIKWIEDEIPQETVFPPEEAHDPTLDKLDAATRREVEQWNEDLKDWEKKQEQERKKWRTPKQVFLKWWAGRHERAKARDARWEARDKAAQLRAQKRMQRLYPLMRAIERSRFAVMLFATMLCAVGVCASLGGSMGYMAAASCAMWLAVALETGYAPVASGIRQRYLAVTAMKSACFLMLVPMYFGAYMRCGVGNNVVLQSAMIILLLAHLLLTLALVAFHKKQSLLLRALSSVLGVIPALMASAAIAMAVTRIALPPLEAVFSFVGALGALMAFAADRAQTLHDLGGIRLRYTPVWTSLAMELGFLMMILGSWIAG